MSHETIPWLAAQILHRKMNVCYRSVGRITLYRILSNKLVTSRQNEQAG
jgi:hypothetical protein